MRRRPTRADDDGRPVMSRIFGVRARSPRIGGEAARPLPPLARGRSRDPDLHAEPRDPPARAGRPDVRRGPADRRSRPPRRNGRRDDREPPGGTPHPAMARRGDRRAPGADRGGARRLGDLRRRRRRRRPARGRALDADAPGSADRGRGWRRRDLGGRGGRPRRGRSGPHPCGRGRLAGDRPRGVRRTEAGTMDRAQCRRRSVRSDRHGRRRLVRHVGGRAPPRTWPRSGSSGSSGPGGWRWSPGGCRG